MTKTTTSSEATRRDPLLSASLICANPLNVGQDLDELIEARIDSIHFDVMDGKFVPRYGLYTELLAALRSKTNLVCDVHMMVENPQDYIAEFGKAGATYFSFHIETTQHANLLISRIREAGMRPGVAINPGTPLSLLSDIITDIDILVLMAINPGIVGHKIIPSTYRRIQEARQLAQDRGREDLLIQIDGGVTFETGNKMTAAGANMLVCGTGTIFRKHEGTIKNKIHQFRSQLSQA